MGEEVGWWVFRNSRKNTAGSLASSKSLPSNVITSSLSRSICLMPCLVSGDSTCGKGRGHTSPYSPCFGTICANGVTANACLRSLSEDMVGKEVEFVLPNFFCFFFFVCFFLFLYIHILFTTRYLVIYTLAEGLQGTGRQVLSLGLSIILDFVAGYR